MIKNLRAYGIPNELVEAIEDMYEDTTAKVLSQDGETKPFKIPSGVLQGDTCTLLVHHSTRLCTQKSHRWQRGGAQFLPKETPG